MLPSSLLLPLLTNPPVPPLSVMLVAGVGMDALINTLWFLCGVIPGHVHGFYVTWTYFSRKRKVLKGRYPGGPKAFIYSSRVINGDASDEKVRQLWREEQRAKEDKLMRKRSSRRSGFGGSNGGGASRRSQYGSELESRRSGPPALGRQRSRRESSTVDVYERK